MSEPVPDWGTTCDHGVLACDHCEICVLRHAVFELKALHQPDLSFAGTELCSACISVWPCPTMRIISDQ